MLGVVPWQTAPFTNGEDGDSAAVVAARSAATTQNKVAPACVAWGGAAGGLRAPPQCGSRCVYNHIAKLTKCSVTDHRSEPWEARLSREQTVARWRSPGLALCWFEPLVSLHEALNSPSTVRCGVESRSVGASIANAAVLSLCNCANDHDNS